MLADDNRVVDDDAEHHDTREHRDHVDRLAPDGHGGECGQERDRYTRRRPERDTDIEENKEGKEHQDQSLPAVLDQNAEALLNELAANIVYFNIKGFR